MPDLILIDGGRGQLNAALAALAELGVEETPIVGLAKREEEIYLPGAARTASPAARRPRPAAAPASARRGPPLRRLPPPRPPLEARTLRSRLDELQGIGPRRRKLLLQRFGSVTGVRAATLEELQAALGRATGSRVWEQLQGPAAEGTVVGQPNGPHPDPSLRSG